MYSWKDKLRDWANQRGAWTHILIGAGIAIVIIAIILAVAMPSKGVVDTNKVDIGRVKTTMTTVVDGLTKKASQAELDSFSENVTNKFNNQARTINGLSTRMGNAENKLNVAREDITTIQGDLTELACTPPEGYLTGTFGNYTLHAKSNESGNFTANVHLLYSLGVGDAANYTAALDGFYAGVNWSVNATIPSYVPIAAFNRTAWGINEIWWNVGVFELVANNETAIPVTCAGLNSTWDPSYAYVEVWPVNRG